jgi:hypothetical protein
MNWWQDRQKAQQKSWSLEVYACVHGLLVYNKHDIVQLLIKSTLWKWSGYSYMVIILELNQIKHKNQLILAHYKKNK